MITLKQFFVLLPIGIVATMFTSCVPSNKFSSSTLLHQPIKHIVITGNDPLGYELAEKVNIVFSNGKTVKLYAGGLHIDFAIYIGRRVAYRFYDANNILYAIKGISESKRVAKFITQYFIPLGKFSHVDEEGNRIYIPINHASLNIAYMHTNKYKISLQFDKWRFEREAHLSNNQTYTTFLNCETLMHCIYRTFYYQNNLMNEKDLKDSVPKDKYQFLLEIASFEPTPVEGLPREIRVETIDFMPQELK